MSKRCTPEELDELRKKWLQVYAPISMRSQEAWRTDWEEGLSALPYLTYIRGAVGGPYKALITIRAQLNFDGGKLEIIQTDLERLWSLDLSTGLSGVHCYKETGDGFQMQFGALSRDSQYITGLCNVMRKIR